MKIYLTIAAVIAIFIVLFQGYLTMAANKSDEQPYKVIRIEKDFEIRLYPSVTMEMITASAKSYKELGYSGFRKGGMTSPVHMDIHDSASFRNPVTPPEFNKDNLPKPIDADVTIQSAIDEYVAVIKFGGFASDADIKINAEKLENALKGASVSYYGNFRYLGYNPSYQLFGRKNEIIINVNSNFK